MTERTPPRRMLASTLLFGAVAGVALSLRAPFVTGVPDTPDGVVLLGAVEEFEPPHFEPRFSGYSLAVFTSRWVTDAFELDSGRVCGMGAAIAASLAIGLLAIALKSQPHAAALPAGLTLAIWPPFILPTLQIGTDLWVLPLLWTGLLLSLRPRAAWGAGALVGIAIGFRPSALFWALGLLASPKRGRAIIGLVGGVLLWLLPTLAVVGVGPYFEEGWRFVAGHFGVGAESAWGGSALAEFVGADSRSRAIALHWVWQPLGLTGIVLLVGTLWSFDPTTRRTPLFWGAVAYSIWIVIAQHPQHGRHAIPVLFLVVAFGVTGWWRLLMRTPQYRIPCVVALFLFALGAVSDAISLGRRYHASRPPVLRVIDDLRDHPDFEIESDRIYVGGDRAFFSRYLPTADVRSVQTREQALADAAALPIRPRRIWISTEVAGVDFYRCRIHHRRDPVLGEWGDRYGLRLEPAVRKRRER